MKKANLDDPREFSETLYEKMQQVNAAISCMELYEFQYALDNLIPAEGWSSLTPDSIAEIEQRVTDMNFYRNIRIKPLKDGHPVVDETICRLTGMLFTGLVTGAYPVAWVNQHFYFDVRSFLFMPRTRYLTDRVISHFGGTPCRQFEKRQSAFEKVCELGYKDFKKANEEIDGFFIASILKLVGKLGKPLVLAIAGQTAAGKTEIVERLRNAFIGAGEKVTSIEIDNFFTDRDHREAHGINSEGKAALHFELFKQCLDDLRHGRQISTPRYNFLDGSSSHDLDGKLKSGKTPVVIDPADIIFMEGNFPFLIEEIVPLIRIKVVYLTDDPIRLKRKWRRDMDLRRKYEYHYFLNRYFNEQYIMAQVAYIPQLEAADMFIDTTNASAWVVPGMSALLEGN